MVLLLSEYVCMGKRYQRVNRGMSIEGTLVITIPQSGY